jgi:hypothetical protein
LASSSTSLWQSVAAAPCGRGGAKGAPAYGGWRTSGLWWHASVVGPADRRGAQQGSRGARGRSDFFYILTFKTKILNNPPKLFLQDFALLGASSSVARLIVESRHMKWRLMYMVTMKKVADDMTGRVALDGLA